MKKAYETLVRRYARAFLNLFGDKLDREHVNMLPQIAAQIEGARFFLLYAQFALGNRSSEEGLENFFVQAGFKKVFVPLIVILSESKRLLLLPRILMSIYEQYLARENIMHFTIESAVPLDTKEQKSLVDFLKRKTGKEIQYTLTLNSALIAGVKIYSDTLGYEHSVKQQLNRLYSE